MGQDPSTDSRDPVQDALERTEGLVQTLVTLSDTLVDDFDVVDFLSLLTSQVVKLTLAAEAGILLADSSGELRVIAASNEQTRLLELFQIQNAEGPCYSCFTSGQQLEVLDLELERTRWPKFSPLALRGGFRSVLAVPMRLRGEVLGALNLFITEPTALGPLERSLVQALADVATIGLLQRRSTLSAQLRLEQVQYALDSRIIIEQAKGIVAEQASLPIDAAFERLRQFSRNSNRPIRELAQEIVDGTMTAEGLAA